MYHAFGRGFQGFRKVVERDLLSRTQTETLFHQRFPLTGRVESQTSYVLRANNTVGNLTKKSDYASTYTYPSGAVRPNAVSSTSGGPTGTIYYAYDNSGNLIGRSPNADPYNTNYQTFQARYNHNQQPIESVTLTGTGATARWESARYLYDAQNRLSRQIEGANGSTEEHLIYLEGYEDRVGGYRTRSYVDDYAHLTRYRYGQLELRFVLTDRLGSVVGVVHADRDSSGHISTLTAESTLAYDVFGTPRHATSWARLGVDEAWPQATPPGQSTPTTRHGFTGHEMLSKQRLIHMRGRLFDPRMGRFTGVDPVIQFPLSTQGLNPYSYLLNNPLAGTDPTGYKADWESVQDRMWAMAGGFGANGSTTTAVLNGLRSAATAVGMSGAAGDAKAAGGSAPTSAAGGRADNGGNVTQAAQKGATPDQPSDIESPTLLPQIVVVAETRAERLARKAVGRDAWALFGIQGSTALVGGGLAAGPEIAGMYYANGGKIVGAGVLTLEALAGDAVGGASIALPVGAVGARALTEVTEYAAPYFSGGMRSLISLTKAKFGHAFSTHGQDATEFLTRRAAGSGKPMGQFLDDQAAARLIEQNIGSLKNGAISVPLPRDFPARVIMPDGSFVPASTIRLVPSGTGVKTAYPEL